MPQSVARTDRDRADRPRDDGPTRVRVPRKATSAEAGGRLTRPAHGGAQRDEGLDVEGRTHGVFPRLPWAPRAAVRGSAELWRLEGCAGRNGRQPAA
jgi:hypothetical protein